MTKHQVICRQRNALILDNKTQIVLTPKIAHAIVGSWIINNQGQLSVKNHCTFYRLKGQKHLPIAANIDQVCLVLAALPKPDYLLADSVQVQSSICKVQWRVIVNKSDLNKHQKIIDTYQKIGFEVILCSAINNETTELVKALDKKTSLFFGQSGVGKSSLIAALFSQDIKTSNLTKGQFGKHTTSVSTLYQNQNFKVIDSPGVRFCFPNSEYNIGQHFPDFAKLKCHFANCKHINEQNCGIKDALAQGKISHSRYLSYQKLIQAQVAAK